MSRHELIKNCLIEQHIARDKAFTDQGLATKASIYAKALEKVPDLYLNQIFREAFKRCQYVPSVKNLLDIFSEAEFQPPPMKASYIVKNSNWEDYWKDEISDRLEVKGWSRFFR